jgi:hypothetical protein
MDERILLAFGAAVQALIEALRKVKELVPELAGKVDDIIGRIEEALDALDYAVVASLIPEALNIMVGRLDPRQHASDGA